MERIKERDEYHLHLPPVRLDMDDIDTICERLSDLGEVSLNYKKFRYDSIDELQKNIARKHIDELTIRINGKGIIQLYIEIANDGVWIHAWECGDKAPAIADYVRKNTPWYSWMPENVGAWGAIGSGLGVLAGILTLGVIIFRPRGGPSYIFTAAVLICGYLTFPARRLRLGATKITLSRESNRQTFWERNGETILVDLCKYGISGAIGFVAGRLWSGWFHE